MTSDRSNEPPGRRRLRRAALALVAALVTLLAACAPPEPPPPPPRTTIEVVTRNSPTTLYEGRDGEPAGLEYELVTAFAEAHGLVVEWEVRHGIGEILEAVSAGEVDLAAAGLTRTAARANAFLTGPAYQQIEEMVVCHRRAHVRRIDDLFGKRIRVIADSSYVETLRRLKPSYPGLMWSTTEEESTEQLLQQVADREIDCTVADSNIVALDRRWLPQLRTPFALGDAEQLAWFVSERGADLVEPLEAWFDELSASGRLQELLDRYYGHTRRFDSYDTSVFFRRVESRLTEFEELFQTAEVETGLDWRLLAAVAYQESHWDPGAISETGVRGIMMLTEVTAEELGVDRLDPADSVLGGARYLSELIERMPTYIGEPDRTWMALAAYNVGYSHLEDARKLAIEVGHNPNTWAGLRRTLPLLSQPKYYRNLEHGYARGNEPVVFVEQIRNYYDLLTEIHSRFDEEEEAFGPGVLVTTALLPGQAGTPD